MTKHDSRSPETTPESTAGDLRDVLGMGTRQSVARLAPGQVIDDAYRIEEEIGAGGMGRVYRAHDQRLGRDVAIKLHARARAGDELVREAAALARLAHPNVVTVYEVGTWAGHPWVAMELVRGGTARAWRKAKPRTPDEIVALYRAAGTGLAAAHAAGLVHRDFKPDNVLVGDDGRARVADFGLAVDLTDAAAAEAVLGTPGYMAPEQRAGQAVDARADQYAFAVSLWEALAGVHPFAVPRSSSTLGQAPTEPADAATPATAPPTTPTAAGPAGKVPRYVDAALRRAMDEAPARRWPTMDALLAAIAPRRSRAWLVAGGAAMLGLGAVVVAVALRGRGAPAIDCAAAATTIDGDWSASAREALGAQLATKGPGDQIARVMAATDAWVTRWRAGSRAACEAAHVTHAQSPALYDQRIACLERGRASLRAFLALVAQSPVAPGKALDAVTALPRVEDCADVAILVGGPAPPHDLVGAAIAARADALIARARAQRTAGDAKGAIASSRDAIAYADDHHLPGASARARVELAAAIHATGTLDGVRATFEEAVTFAAEAHDDALVARTWINVIDAIAIRLKKPEEAEQLLAVAEAAIVRAGKPPTLVGLLAGSRGDLALARDQYAEAVPLIEKRIATGEAIYGAEDVDQTRWRNRLAQALLELRRFDEARAQLTRAAEIIERHYGPTHPSLGVVLTTRGQVEYTAGNYAAAIAHYEQALALKTAISGPDHASLAPTLINLAYAHADAGSPAAALVHATRGAAIAERTLPPMHPNLGMALALRGRVEAETGAWPAAEATLARAIDILTKAGERPPLDQALRARALVHLQSGRTAAALTDATRAVAIAEAELGPSLDLAATLTARAEAERAGSRLIAARASYARAIEVARACAGAEHPVVARLVAAAAKLDAR
ncbi:MAG: serine/threonine-protein kinase [Kofleriaceae bacterium]|nr:serine/threonine-protein kinase [Kofleriaceae bacterium]